MISRHLYKQSIRRVLRIGLWAAVFCILGWVIVSHRSSFDLPKSAKWVRQDYAILAPRFYSLSSEGKPYMIEAVNTTQNKPKEYHFESPTAYFKKDNGDIFKILSNNGRYYQDKSMLYLSGNVTMSNTDNYQIHTENASIDLKQQEAEGQDSVHGEGPLGSFRGEGGFKASKTHLTVKGPVEAYIREDAFHKESVED